MKEVIELITRWQLTLDVSEERMSPELREMVKDTIKALRELRERQRRSPTYQEHLPLT